jgi:hypothetical protein
MMWRETIVVWFKKVSCQLEEERKIRETSMSIAESQA